MDALRGVFALVIVAAHIGLLNGSPWVLSSVDLFFVLSGYFITNNVMKNRQSPGFLSVFFTRRALRIWPAYYLALAACLLLSRKLRWDAPPDAWPYYLTFTQNVQAYLNWPLPKFSGMFIHTWTLAIEEQFYLLWPLLLRRTGRRTTLAVVLMFAVMPTVGRVLGYSPYLLLTRCDGLALGALLSVVLSDRERVARRLFAYRAAFATIGLTALIVPELTGLASTSLGPAFFTTRASIVYFGLAGLTLCLQGHPALRPLRDRRLCYIGSVSYGLYLYHPLVFGALPKFYKKIVFRQLGLTSELLMNVTMVAVCFLLAELSSRFVEGPILALKDRLTFGSRNRTPDQIRVDPAGTAVDGPRAAGARLPVREGSNQPG